MSGHRSCTVVSRIAALCFVLTLAGMGSSVAQEHGEEASPGTTERHEHSFHPNDFGLFLGATDEKDEDPQFTAGLDYERRLSEHWGVGGLVDYAGGDLRNTVLAVPVFWHPGGGWKLMAAPGIEFHDGECASGDVHADDPDGEVDEDETNFLFRVGVGYHFHVSNHWGVVPTVNLDFVDGEEVWVYGVGLAYGW